MRNLMILSVMLLALPGLAHGQVADATSGLDPIHAERKATIPKARPWPMEWFQPQEIVRGVRTPKFPTAGPRTIAPEALDAAARWAMERETQALLVWRDGNLELARFAPGLKPTERLNSYYMHFPVLSLLYGAAIADGVVGSADDPIGKYISEWNGDARGKITLRQLLTMHAGLEMYFDNTDATSKESKLFLGADSTTPALQFAAIEAPGSSFQYNYLVPEILGIALQRALGKQRYADYLSKRLWKPLGNGDAAVWLDRPGGRPHYNSALFAGAYDWLNVGKLILNRGKVGNRQVIPASWIQTMTTRSAKNPNYGMLWFGSPYRAERRFSSDPRYKYKVASSAPYLADDLIFLDGYGGQRVYIVPSKQLIIVRIGLTRRDWDDSGLPNAIIAGIK